MNTNPTTAINTPQPKYKKLIKRLPTNIIRSLIPDAAQRLLKPMKLIDETMTEERQFRKVLLDLFPPHILIDNKDVLRAWLEALPEQDWPEMCMLLNGEAESVAEEVSVQQFAQQVERILNCQENSTLYNRLFDWMDLPEKVAVAEQLETTKQPKWEKIEAAYPLRDYQIDVVERAARTLKEQNVMLHLPTGAGKTRTAMNLIVDLLRKAKRENTTVVWLTSQKELCAQAANEFKKAWSVLGNQPVGILKHYDDHTKEPIPTTFEIPTLVVMTIQSLHSFWKKTALDPYTDPFKDFGRNCDLIVFDEAHQAIAKTWNEAIQYLLYTARDNDCRVLGLTATPGRHATADSQRLAGLFDSQKVGIEIEGKNPIQYLREVGVLAEQVNVTIELDDDLVASDATMDRFILDEKIEIHHDETIDYTDDAITTLGRVELRNKRIIEYILDEAKDEDAHIIVFACTIAHANALSTLLKLHGEAAEAVSSMTPKAEQELIIERFRSKELKIIVNCDLLTTGFDVPSANVAVLARPTKSLVLYSQMIGRVIRGTATENGTETCRVLTVNDTQYGFDDLSNSFNFWEGEWKN